MAYQITSMSSGLAATPSSRILNPSLMAEYIHRSSISCTHSSTQLVSKGTIMPHQLCSPIRTIKFYPKQIHISEFFFCVNPFSCQTCKTVKHIDMDCNRKTNMFLSVLMQVNIKHEWLAFYTWTLTHTHAHTHTHTHTWRELFSQGCIWSKHLVSQVFLPGPHLSGDATPLDSQLCAVGLDDISDLFVHHRHPTSRLLIAVPAFACRQITKRVWNTEQLHSAIQCISLTQQLGQSLDTMYEVLCSLSVDSRDSKQLLNNDTYQFCGQVDPHPHNGINHYPGQDIPGLHNNIPLTVL